jgi:hypothetical protein
VILLVTGLILLVHSLDRAEGLDVVVKEGYAPVSGYLQAPAGGNPGTSDMKRPTLEELGVDDITFTDIDFHYQRNLYTPYLGIRLMTADSSGALEQDLTTRGQNFIKGEYFSHETSFNIYRLGVKRDFTYLTANIELAFMDFNYEFRTAGASVERSYMKSSVRLGAEKSFTFDKFEIVVESSGSVPLSNTPDIYSVGALVKYYFTNNVNVGVGVQYFYLDYEDEQNVPNHLRLEMQPALSLSLQCLL